MRKISVKEVAAHAGVSRATADRVLNNRGGVSPAKERAVLISARALGLDRNLDAVRSKLLRVCVLMQGPENPFYDRLARGFRQANEHYSMQAISVYISHIDVLAPETIHVQLQQIATSYDALVVVAPATEQIIDALRMISDRVPVITVATDLPLGSTHHYVGPNNYQAGRLAGELMGRMMGPTGGEVLLIAGLREFRGHQERRNGFAEVLRDDFPQCTLSTEIDSFDHGRLVADLVVYALRGNTGLKGIYNISQGNDEICKRLKRNGLSRHHLFVCHDLTATTRALLLTRQIDVVIDQDPFLEAMRALEIILRHYGRLDSGPLDGRTPLRVFFRENAEGEIL